MGGRCKFVKKWREAGIIANRVLNYTSKGPRGPVQTSQELEGANKKEGLETRARGLD